MPLDKSGTKASVSRNVRTEINSGRPPKQAEAIAYSVKRAVMAHKLKRKKACKCGGACGSCGGGK